MRDDLEDRAIYLAGVRERWDEAHARPPFPSLSTDDDEAFVRQTIDWLGGELGRDDLPDAVLYVAYRAALIAERLRAEVLTLRARVTVDGLLPRGYCSCADTTAGAPSPIIPDGMV